MDAYNLLAIVCFFMWCFSRISEINKKISVFSLWLVSGHSFIYYVFKRMSRVDENGHHSVNGKQFALIASYASIVLLQALYYWLLEVDAKNIRLICDANGILLLFVSIKYNIVKKQ